MENRRSYEFGKTWWWVYDDKIFIFERTIRLTSDKGFVGKHTLKAHCTSSVLWSLEVLRCNRLLIESLRQGGRILAYLSFFSIKKQRILCICKPVPTQNPFSCMCSWKKIALSNVSWVWWYDGSFSAGSVESWTAAKIESYWSPLCKGNSPFDSITTVNSNTKHTDKR